MGHKKAHNSDHNATWVTSTKRSVISGVILVDRQSRDGSEVLLYSNPVQSGKD